MSDAARRIADGRRRATLAHELRASEARFRDVIERNADAIVVLDHEGVVCFANPMAERLFGRADPSLVGTTFGFPLVAGETTEIDVVSQGAPRTVEMRVVASMWDGHDAYIASLRDITERKQAEQDARRLIREQTAREAAEQLARRQRFLLDGSTRLSSSLDYDATLATLADLCVTGVADWAVVFCTDAAGHPERAAVAHRDAAQSATVSETVNALRSLLSEPSGPHPIVEAFSSRTPRLVPHVDAEVLAALCRNSRETELVRRLGVSSLMILPMLARGRQLGGLVLVTADAARPFDEDDMALTEDIAARAALSLDNAGLYAAATRANQARSDLLAVVSHDLRTPLTAIIGYADLLAMGIPDILPSASQQHVERIRKSAQHLLYLMNELLTFTRLDAGRETLHLREVDVREVVREVATFVEPSATTRGLAVEMDVPDRPLPLRTDPDKMRQVLLNLAGNAVKYTTQGGIGVRLTAAADAVTVQVRDSGVGIAPDDLPNIYDPFWQADLTRRSKDGGTGLGLSIVRRLVDLLGGTVRVESTVGRGTTFTVTVPNAR
jgi:signal transduction histidine kinase